MKLLTYYLLLAIYDDYAFLGQCMKFLSLHVVDALLESGGVPGSNVLDGGYQVCNLHIGILYDVHYRTVVVPCPVANGTRSLVGNDTGEIGRTL